MLFGFGLFEYTMPLDGRCSQYYWFVDDYDFYTKADKMIRNMIAAEFPGVPFSNIAQENLFKTFHFGWFLTLMLI